MNPEFVHLCYMPFYIKWTYTADEEIFDADQERKTYFFFALLIERNARYSSMSKSQSESR